MAFEFEERISGFQRFVLKASVLVGVLVFFGGVQLTVRGRADLGGPISGFGMFIAVSMKWGIKGLYDKIRQKRPALLERWGHAKLFWVLFVVAFGLESVGVVSVGLYVLEKLTGQG